MTILQLLIEVRRGREVRVLDPPDLHRIVEQLPDALIVADMDGRIRYANAAAAQLLGYSQSELGGKLIEDIMPERYRNAHREGMRRLRTTRVPVLVGRAVAVEALRSDGVEVPVELALSLPSGPEGSQIMAIIRDLRERVPLDAELARVRDVLGAQQYARLTAARESQLDRDALETSRVLAATRLRVLAELGSMLSTPLPIEEALQRTAELCAQAVGEWSVIYRLMPDGHTLRTVAGAHRDAARNDDVQRLSTLSGASREVGSGPGVAEVVVSGEPALFRDISDETLSFFGGSEERRALMESIGFISGAAAPIRSPTGPLGAIAVGAGKDAPLIDDEDLAFLQQLADRVGTALAREILRQQLERQETRLGHILDQLPEGVLVRETDGSVIANHAARELAQRGSDWPSPEEWPFAGVLRDERGDVLPEEELPLPRAMAGLSSSQEYAVRAPDGSLRWLLVNAGPLVDEGGSFGAVAVFQDITERKRSREATRFLAEASEVLSSSLDYEATLRALANIAVPGLADWCVIDILTKEGVPETVAIAHVDPDRVKLAREIRARYPSKLESPHGIGNVLRTGNSEVVRDISDDILRSLAHDDEHYRLLQQIGMRSLVIAPLRGHGRILGVLTLVAAESAHRFDADDVRLIEDLARRASLAVENARLYRDVRDAVRLRDDFLSVASHELRTPLTALTLQVSAFAASLRAGRDLKISAKQIDRVDAQVQRMTTLIDQLLNVSRIAAGRMELELVECDLVTIVRECVSRFEEQVTRAGSRIDVRAPASAVGRWDANRLDQVVTNLLSNALKFGAGQTIDVTVREAATTVSLSVRDRGVGISGEDQARIFERFERAVSIRKFGGMGLGLWIVKELVDAHGGSIAVTSVPGAGATFTVELPRESREPDLRRSER